MMKLPLVVLASLLFFSLVPQTAFSAFQTDAEPWLTFDPPPGTSCGKTVFLLSGDEEYRSEEAMPMLGRLLSQRFGFRCVVLFPINPETGEIDPNNQTDIPGLERLGEADLVIMAWRFRRPSGEAMRHLDAHVRNHRPIIGLRTSTHAFNFPASAATEFRHYSFDSGEPWPGGFGRQILGETWISHHGQHGSQSTRGIVEEGAGNHPILAGVSGVWGPTDVYGVTELPADAVVLMRGLVLEGMSPDSEPLAGPKNDPSMPLVWCREMTGGEPDAGGGTGDSPEADSRNSGKRRVVCTTMGAANDFVQPGLRRVIANAALWCLEIEDRIDPEASVELVGEYHPSDFGFNTFRRGVRPADFRDGIPPR